MVHQNCYNLDMNLQNKRVLLTGATGGIGSVLAVKLAQVGAQLILLGRDQDKLSRLGRDLKADIFPCDLTDRSSRQETLNAVLHRYPSLDLLIHAAGVGIYKPLPDITQADWDTSFALNVEATFFLTQALTPQLEKSSESLVLTIGSGAGVIPMRGRSLYCATKFALRGLILSLAEEQPQGRPPHYCLITLGSTLTPFGPLTMAKKKEASLNGKAYFTPEWVADKLVQIIEDENRATEITLYPGDYGFGTWTKP